ncbi:MAG TPA: TonB family protein [Macromonas sp.]|nr:TonB family protein [Macromonas sp.]
MTWTKNCSLLNRRNAVIAAGVLALHGLLLALLLGVRSTPQLPADVLEIEAAWILDAQPTPQPKTAPAAAKPTPSPQKQVAAAKTETAVRTTAPTAAPTAEASTPAQPASPAEAPAAAAPPASSPTGAAKPSTAPAPAEPKVELPSSSADYLNNARPPYPPLSKRLNEQGKVVVNVLIATDGTASQAVISSSSGYDRLDQAALKAVLGWRYVPGKRNGVPAAMRYDVPVNFVLTEK